MARHWEPIAETNVAPSSRQPHCQPFDPSCCISGGADKKTNLDSNNEIADFRHELNLWILESEHHSQIFIDNITIRQLQS